MYQPPMFKEERIDILQGLIRKSPLGLLITYGEQGIMADLIPFALTEGGALYAHISRANPQMAALKQHGECLVVFQGPECYITPSWYAEKQSTGRVVPTWNYVVVQVHGEARLIDDIDWIRNQVMALTALHEQPRENPWALTDAPEDFVESQLRGIIGIEMTITRMEGKWKVSQNRSAADQVGVYQGLVNDGNDDMASLVSEWGNHRNA